MFADAYCGKHHPDRGRDLPLDGSSTCRTPAEFCADWEIEQVPAEEEADPQWLVDLFGPFTEPPILLPGGQVLLTALRHFAHVRHEPSIEDFERLLGERGRGLHPPRGADPGAVAWGTGAANHLLGRWREYRAVCSAKQRERAWPGWAVYGYRYRGVCQTDADGVVAFCQALLDLEWAYSLPQEVDRDVWVSTLRRAADGRSMAAFDRTLGAADTDSAAMSHLLASWDAYLHAWEAHACRTDPCHPAPGEEPYSGADAFWDNVGRASHVIGHRAQFQS